MKQSILLKLAFLLVFLSCVSSLCAQDSTDDGQQRTIRIFYKNGETQDINVTDIDYITSTTEAHRFWQYDTYTEVAIESIDSICYISPQLRLSAKQLHFGQVAVGNSKTITICITNTGDYPETYTLLADGVFSTDISGKEILIGPGTSQDLDLTFRPAEVTPYSGELLVSSNSVETGILKLPLAGNGVTLPGEEQESILPPKEQTFMVVLPKGLPADASPKLKIENFYGEYPVEMISEPARVKGIGTNAWFDNSLFANGMISQNGGIFNFVMDSEFGIPYLFSISFPDDAPVSTISPEETAIALLMSDPLLITSNEAEYKNTVNTIKKLDSWYDFLTDVEALSLSGMMNQMCPDYSVINAKPVILELIRKVFDNHDLTLDGLSLDDLTITPELVKYRIHNDYKRVIHAYPSRVKMNEANTVIMEQEASSYTLTELCEWILTTSDLVGEELDEEDREFITDLKSWIGEIEEFLVSVGLGDADTHLQMPIIVDSEKSNYWKIVKDSWNGSKSSVFETVSDEIESSFMGNDGVTDFDKIFIDIYGMGTLDKSWSSYSGSEKYRIIFALLHGAYKDFISPLVDLAVGINKAADATGSDNYKYDFRYGKRKAPVVALIKKLALDFFSNPQNVIELYENIHNRDLWGTAKQLTMFVCDRILTCPSEDPNDDKRTYTNLIYNIYKKWSKNSATSKQFRDQFKAVANNLTHLKRVNFASKVINVAESSLDLAGAIDAYSRSTVKQTFVIDKSDHPYITIIAPTQVYNSMSIPVHFEWKTYKAKNFGTFLYDLIIYVETPERGFHFTALSNIDGTSCDINLGNVLNNNQAGNAITVKYQIVAHHPENPSTIYAKTEYNTLATLTPASMPRFVDLGLPSGNLWAECNHGATTSTAYGNYYAWGETTGYNQGKSSFSWKNYKYCRGTNTTLTKYCTKASYGNNGFTDGIVKLQGIDDPISCSYGYNYSIPSKADWDELINECTWIHLGNGALVFGKNGKHIYLPATGYRSGIEVYDAKAEGYYWTSTLDQNSPDDAWFVYIGRGKPSNYDYYRCQGRSLRAVMHPDTPEGSSAPRTIQTPIEKHGSDGLVVKCTTGSRINQ